MSDILVGILVLDSRFPRILGDIGNPETWDFGVRYRVVEGATPDIVVRGDVTPLLDSFISASRELASEGVDCITTTCGFLSLFQTDLSSCVPVPVLTSSLIQVDLLNRVLPLGKRVGILTISGSTLTSEHLRLAGVPSDTPIGTTEGGEFSRVILNDEEVLDVDRACRENVEASVSLISNHPDIGALVLECTNMVPYSSAIAKATGVPVFSLLNFVEWFASGLRPRSFDFD